MATRVSTDTGFDFDKPELAVPGEYIADGTGHPGYDVMPDGSFVLVTSQPRGRPHRDPCGAQLVQRAELARSR